jgi:hypothetical protein
MGELLAADMQIAVCSLERAVPQEDLDGARIAPRVEQVGGTAVSQRLNAPAMLDTGAPPGVVVNLACRATGHVALGVVAGEEPGLMTLKLPIGA